MQYPALGDGKNPRKQERYTEAGYPPGDGLADVLLVRHLVNCPRAHVLFRVLHIPSADNAQWRTQDERVLSLHFGT